jgi:hypothetical protein
MLKKEEKRQRFNLQSMEDKRQCVDYFGIYLMRLEYSTMIRADVYIMEEELVEVWINLKSMQVFAIRIPSFEQLDNYIDSIDLPEEFYG